MQRFLGRVRERIVNDSLRVDKAFRSTLGQIHFEDNHDLGNTVILAGSGRGGTTWIAEILNFDNEFRFIFEPFQKLYVPLARNYRNRQYLRPDDNRPEFVGTARRLLSGDFRNGWADAYNRKLYAKRRLVKDIRINLMLKWIHDTFPETLIVLLLRHPCAVAASRVALHWYHDLADFFNQPDLMSEWLAPYEKVMRETEDPFERHILRWCIENWLPLKQFHSGEIYVAFYEEFCVHPQRAVSSLFDYVRKPVSDAVFEKMGRPSSQTRKRESAVMIDQRPTDAWKKTVTPAQSRRAQELIALFGLDRIYTEDPLPNMSSVRTLPLA